MAVPWMSLAILSKLFFIFYLIIVGLAFYLVTLRPTARTPILVLLFINIPIPFILTLVAHHNLSASSLDTSPIPWTTYVYSILSILLISAVTMLYWRSASLHTIAEQDAAANP